MKSLMRKQNSEPMDVCHGDLASSQNRLAASKARGKKISRTLLQLSVTAALLTFPILARSQSLPFYGDDSASATDTTSGNVDLAYVRPTQKTKIINYVFDTFGPYPIAGAAFAAGINQFSNSPPEWNQGVEGYCQAIRFRLRHCCGWQPLRAMGCQKLSRKMRCITGANAVACFRGCAMLCSPP